MQLPRWVALLAGSTLAAACSNEAVAPGAQLAVDFRIDASHIHALETNVTYTVLVTSGTAVVTDFEAIAVEYALVGTDTWFRVPLTGQAGGSFTGTHQYPTAGNFSLRLVGKRKGQSAESVLHTLATPVSPIRPHWDAGGYRVEFDVQPWTPPLRANIAYALRFSLMQATADPSGVRPPITGLTGVTLTCMNADGSTMRHNATESTGGVYWISHTFPAAGGVSAQLEFSGSSGTTTVTMPLTLAP